MVAVTFMQPDGTPATVDIAIGRTLRDGAVTAMIEGVVGMCGGSMSCATCHCYINEEWLDKLAPMTPEERDVLELAIDVRPNSRLTCQIEIDSALEGLLVTVPEEQP
jgi:ferredoxin, 2Fe-2S